MNSDLAWPKIRLPRTRLIFTESCLLYQVIILINCTHTINTEILEEKNHEKTHTPILDSISMSQGYTYLHIPMNALCPITLNVMF